jgi:hypothetical protein
MNWLGPTNKSWISVSTSRGMLELTAEEYQLLKKIVEGTSSMNEGQQFYQMITSRGLPLPLEWEAPILRATLAKLPERADLSQRLATVEASLGIQGRSDATISDRSVWESALARFSATSLIGSNNSKETVDRQANSFADACVLLSSPYFSQLPVERQASTILSLHDTLMSVPSADLYPIAELGLRQFRRMLDDPALTMPQALSVFDALHSLFFSGVSDVQDLKRFDAIVQNFESWLKVHTQRPLSNKLRMVSEDNLTVAYLLHTAHFDRGNAVSRLIVSLAEMHAAQPNRRIFLYLVQYIDKEFVGKLAGTRVTIRQFPQDRNYGAIDRILSSLNEDRVDVVVTEQNRAIAAALFVQRAAPIQIWADTGFPYWSLRSLDWTLSPVWAGEPNPLKKISRLSWRQKPDTLKEDTNPTLLAEIRAQFPPDAFILGVFVRLIKLTPEFLGVLDKLLECEPTFWLIIAGTGDAKSVHEYVMRSPYHSRILFHHGNVDLNLYGQVIDVMCDTFPFIGGNACREVGAHGTAVVSLLGTPWDAFLRQDRSPNLLAQTAQAYVDLVLRLFHDENFRAQQREIASQLYRRHTEPQQMIEDVEIAISAVGKTQIQNIQTKN